MEHLPDGARIETGPGGLERLALHAAEGEAHVYLHGAHVAHFQPRGARPVLWTSAASRFEAGAPIRGGVPVCFPWFGPRAGSPQHGFARILPWTLKAVTPEPDGGLRASLELAPETSARAGFTSELRPSLALTVSRSLRIDLAVRNAGAAAATFEEALHSYFAVSDARQVRVGGLEGAAYLDTTAGRERRPGASEPIAIAGETDRLYPATTATVTIADPGWARRIVVAKHGSATTVVWNPWVAKSKAMPDFGDDEWTGMVCVETANALDDAVRLAPGESHVMTAAIEVVAD